MANQFISFAFTAGVLSEKLLFRADLEKYDIGLRKARNWFVDYRGGVSTRPGLEFVDNVQTLGKEARLIPFKFNTSLGNNIVILFTKDRIRFIQNGAYILESGVSISGITNANPGVVTTSSPHGFSDGDFVQLSGTGAPELEALTFRVTNKTSTTFELHIEDANGGTTPFDSPGASGGQVSRVYTISNPYSPEDFKELVYDQDLDVIYLTHENYVPRKLSRFANNNWSLDPVDFDGNSDAPTNLSLTPTNSPGASSKDKAGVAYTVTATDSEGKESFALSYELNETTINFTTERGAMSLSWDNVNSADYYNVYRTIVVPVNEAAPARSKISYSDSFGYLGQATAPTFIDANIVPDFTRFPPIRYRPFADGAVRKINITNGGTDYTKGGTTVSITSSTGSGFKGLVIEEPDAYGSGSGGEVIGVKIVDPGSGYKSTDTVVFNSTNGSGATADLEVTETSGNNPRANALVQQRRIYAGTLNQPMTLFASQPGTQDNFDYTQFQTAADSFEIAIDASELTPIKFIIPIAGGLFAFTESTVWRVAGTDDSVLSPGTARANVEFNGGTENLLPLQIKDTIVFLQFRGNRVLSFMPGRLRDTFEVKEVSLFSSDFFRSDNKVISWAFVESPNNMVWAVREDGTLLSMAYVPEQNVYAWTEHDTKGRVKDVVSIFEGKRDVPYYLVERDVNGETFTYLERMADREITSVEEVFALDSGVKTEDTFPAATITPTYGKGTGDFVEADSAIFSASDIGKHLRVGGGRGIVVGVNIANDTLTVDWVIDMTEFKPQEPDTPIEAKEGEWSLNETFLTFSGLSHLEGEEVAVFADGNVLPNKTVSGGKITLDAEYSKVFAGLNYDAELQTLPIRAREEVIEGRQKRIVKAAIRLLNSRGLEIGSTIEQEGIDYITYPLKERTTEKYAEPTRLQSRLLEQTIGGEWTEDNSLVIRKNLASHATILGLIIDAEIGND